MPFLFALQTLFSLWLLTDAIKRRAECYWYWIIMMPFGEWVYFFTVKINDPELKQVGERLLKKKISMSEIEYQARTSPSLHNKLILAQAKHDSEEYHLAAELFREILTSDAQHKKALYGLGLCYNSMREYRKAAEVLSSLVELDYGYKDYGACVALADSYSLSERPEDAVEVLEKVVGSSKRIRHSTELAKHLVTLRRETQARELIDAALESYENSPRHIRKSEKCYAREAKRLQQAL